MKGGVMKRIVLVSIVTLFFALTCVLVTGAVSAQEGWEKTVTLPSGEKVLDMRGEWDVLVETHGRASWFGSETSICLITQEGTTFSGVKQTEGKISKGTKTLKGVLDKDGFKEVQVYTPLGLWVPVTWEISEHGNKIVFLHEDRVRWTLTRR
jgi:hypothetical protein